MTLISAENISSIDLLLDVVEAGVISIGDDGVGLVLKIFEVVDNEAAKECGAVLEGGLVDDDLGALGLDALHHALDGGLAEVIGVGFHREAVDTNHWNGCG